MAKKYHIKPYTAVSGKGDGKQRVFAFFVDNPNELKITEGNNAITTALANEGFKGSQGTYFFRFIKDSKFIKIGATPARDIITRLKRGFNHEKSGNTDGYFFNKDGKEKAMKLVRDSINTQNPIYFIFYEMLKVGGVPEVDELCAQLHHYWYFRDKTIQEPDFNVTNTAGLMAVWHYCAFNEVVNASFPDGTSYSSYIP